MEEWIIDAHAHIGRFEGYDLSEETLLHEMDEAGIALALISNIDGAAVAGKTPGLDEPAANRITLGTVRQYPTRFRGLLWGRPDGGDPAHLRPFLEERAEPTPGGWTRRAFVGLKLHPEMNDFRADDGAVDPYLHFAHDARIPVVIHSDARDDRASPQRIVALGRRHPEVPIVLYHTGFQGPHRETIAAVGAVLDQDEADLYLETAQLPAEWAMRAVERVGVERVLFGTDATYFGTGHYQRYAPLIRTLTDELGPAGARAVLRENTLELFRLLADEPEWERHD